MSEIIDDLKEELKKKSMRDLKKELEKKRERFAELKTEIEALDREIDTHFETRGKLLERLKLLQKAAGKEDEVLNVNIQINKVEEKIKFNERTFHKKLEEKRKELRKIYENEKQIDEKRKTGFFYTVKNIGTDENYRALVLAWLLISTVTVIFVVFALNNEMAGLFATRPLDVTFFILVFGFLVVLGIFLYPYLVANFREKILCQEAFLSLSRKYHEGLAELYKELEESGLSAPSFSDDIDEETSAVWERTAWTEAWDKVAAKHPNFAFLYTVEDEYFKALPPFSVEEQDKTGTPADQIKTPEQQRKEYRDKLIRKTGKEHIRETNFCTPSYELPVIYCMLSVAFGFIVLSLIPFLDISKIAFGESSINLIWAAGGFTGAYLYSLYPLFQRYTRRDLPPRAFLDYAIRVFLGTMAVTVFGNLFSPLLEWSVEVQFALSAVLGSVPLLLLNEARNRGFQMLRWLRLSRQEDNIGSRDVSVISGISHEYSARLNEEGIMNVQQLAFANSEILSERTRFNRETVQNWKDEAILRLLTGNIPIKRFVDKEEEKKKMEEEKKKREEERKKKMEEEKKKREEERKKKREGMTEAEKKKEEEDWKKEEEERAKKEEEDWKKEEKERKKKAKAAEEGEEESLYSALTMVGVNTVSDLANFLQGNKGEVASTKGDNLPDQEKNKKGEVASTKGDNLPDQEKNITYLVNLLGWKNDVEKYKCMLNSIRRRGLQILVKHETYAVSYGIEKNV